MEHLFTNPSGLFFLLLLPVIVGLHLLRARPRRYVVPSLLLWQEGATASVANSFWQRLNKYRELITHLVTALCLTLAFAGFTLPGVERSLDKRIVVLDVSPSMLALTQSGTTRLELAKDHAKRLLNDLDDDDQVGLVLAGDELEVVSRLGTSRSRVLEAIEQVGVGSEGIDNATLERELWALASKLGGDVEFVFLSGPLEAELVEKLPLSVAVKTFGKPIENKGIVALEVRQDPDEEGRFEVEGLGTGDSIARLEIEQAGEWKLIDAHRAPLRFDLSVSELPARGRLRLQESDEFSVDDVVEFELRDQEGMAVEIYGEDENLSRLLKVLGADSQGRASKGQVWIVPETPPGLEITNDVEGFVTYYTDSTSAWWHGLEYEVIEMAGPSLELDSDWQALLSVAGNPIVARQETNGGGVNLAFSIPPSRWPQFSQSNTFITLLGRWYRDNAAALELKGPRVTDGLLDSRQSRKVSVGESYEINARLKPSERTERGFPLWPWLLVVAFFGLGLSTYFVSHKSRNH